MPQIFDVIANENARYKRNELECLCAVIFTIKIFGFQKSLNVSSLKIVEDALSKVSGKLIPYSSIIHLSRPEVSVTARTTSVTSKDIEQTEKPDKKRSIQDSVLNSVLPFSSVIDAYLHGIKTSSTWRQEKVIKLHLLSADGMLKFFCPEIRKTQRVKEYCKDTQIS